MQAIDELFRGFTDGNKRAVARVISIVEDRGPEANALLNRIYPQVGQANRVGITGPPGAGKSTLVDQMTDHWVETGEKVAVVAVDPTSPFSGGALLGDRIRMGRVVNHGNVFFRSMASRGSLGGLALQTSEVVDVLDAAGYGTVILETVGVGQSELEVAEEAFTTVVVLVPESGDGIQAMKAGLMEIADIFVVNKADRTGARRLAAEIESTLELKHWDGWKPPVLLTEARAAVGIPKVMEQVSCHRAHLEDNGLLLGKKRRSMESRVRSLVLDQVTHRIFDSPETQVLLDDGLSELTQRKSTPYRLANDILRKAALWVGDDRQS